MPKYARTKATGNEGVAALSKVVASHGSILRETPEQTDVGIDAFIELVVQEQPSGMLVGAQVKSGESYVADDGTSFSLPVDPDHLRYWEDLAFPVLLVGYSPNRDLLAGVLVHDVIDHARYHGRPIKSVRIPFADRVDHDHLDRLVVVASRYQDQFTLIKYLDSCYSEDRIRRRHGVTICTQHPATRYSRTVIHIARHLLSDEDEIIRRMALYHLGRRVASMRWSWNPNNKDERECSRYASRVCSDLTIPEVKQLLVDVRDSVLYGPDSQLERLFDVCVCARDDVSRFLEDVASSAKSHPDDRRSACWMINGGSLDSVGEAVEAGDELAIELFGHLFDESGSLRRS